MKYARSHSQDCRVSRQLDAYLDGELSPEAAFGLRQHLKGCPACCRELEAKQYLRNRLKTAVTSVPVPAWLEGRLRSDLRQSLPGWGAPLAAALLCFGAAIVYQLGNLLLT